jgi:hypothetical protein
MHLVGIKRKNRGTRESGVPRFGSHAGSITSPGHSGVTRFQPSRELLVPAFFSTRTELTPIISFTVDEQDRRFGAISMIDRHDLHSHMRAMVRCDTVALTRFRVGRPSRRASGWLTQFRRMSGTASNPWSCWKPTAATVPSLRAVAPNSPSEKLPGFGLLMIFQLVPSQRSVRVA